jgi:hypothetical protein
MYKSSCHPLPKKSRIWQGQGDAVFIHRTDGSGWTLIRLSLTLRHGLLGDELHILVSFALLETKRAWESFFIQLFHMVSSIVNT